VYARLLVFTWSAQITDFLFNTAYLKKLHKNASPKFAEATDPAEAEKEWKTKAAGAMKKILANWDNYDVLMGQSMDGDAMYVPTL
jgi:Translationally controlled tumour protein.